MNLFDIMRQAGDGRAFQTFGGQFGLSEDQVRRAMEALLPAFSVGLKRSAADPLSFFELMRHFAMAPYASYYQHPGRALGGGTADGQELLSLLFGSKDVSRLVAEQASAFSGIAEETLKRMMPAIAATLFGGIHQQAVAANPMLEAMFKQFGTMTAPRTAAKPEKGGSAKGPLDRLEEEEEKAATEANPFAGLQHEAMQAGLSAMTAGTEAWGEMMKKMAEAAGAGLGTAGAAGGPAAKAPGSDLFGELFEPGVRIGKAYQRQMETMLERQRPAAARG